MAKNCNLCENFGGYDQYDDMPICGIEGGCQACPYNDELPPAQASETPEPFDVRLDTTQLTEYIRHTLQNTIQREARQIAEQQIRSIVNEAYEDNIQQITEKAIAKVVDEQIAKFMAEDITIGGGWREDSRTISRKDYMAELVQKELDKRFDANGVRKEAENLAGNAINKFLKDARDQINRGTKQYFDTATRQILTDSVVSVLMDNETYRRLSESMGNLLSDGK